MKSNVKIVSHVFRLKTVIIENTISFYMIRNYSYTMYIIYKFFINRNSLDYTETSKRKNTQSKIDHYFPSKN